VRSDENAKKILSLEIALQLNLMGSKIYLNAVPIHEANSLVLDKLLHVKV
jgi:hypothetical protein